MIRKTKYQPLADYLITSNKEEVVLTFSKIEEILGFKLSPSARKHRANWSNNEIEALSWGWRNAGYESYGVDMKKEIVRFRKVRTVVALEAPIKKRSFKKAQHVIKKVENAIDEILLDVPDNLVSLEQDEYYMVKLCKENSEIVEAEIIIDPDYRPIGREAFEKRMIKEKDFSSDAYYEVINRIATENSTRTSKITMRILADYLSNPNNKFLERLSEGKPQLVDDLLNYLVKKGERRDKSLVSKICRYLNEWLYQKDDYTINDSVVRKILPYYLAYYKIDKTLWQTIKLDDLSYVEFIGLFDLVNANVSELTRHQLDHLIWYAYKNDSIRSSIASSLSLNI